MEKTYTYEVTENGYFIFIDGKKVIHQYEPYIPDPNLSYEENAKAQIEELKQADLRKEEEKTEVEKRILNLEKVVTETN